ncbi:MAG: 50S ribosomal protein L10 [Deltaproteobacteria bacterium]|jgi:large subunit ribosomal protein L10|nr:50S ribosomal protein L10 [Deltaproteobacteria bacterium]
MERKKKEAVVAELRGLFQSSQAIIVTDFKGLSMETLSSLRRKVRQAGAEFKVTKNTLVRLAAKDNPIQQLDSLLDGNNALGYTSGDPAALAKVLFDFAKTEEKLVIKGGVLGPKAMNTKQIVGLAKLPSREILLSSLLGTMQAVPASLVRVLAAVPQKLLYALSAIKDSREAA